MRNVAFMRKTRMIQVRSVPERLHHELVKRASALGLTLTEYIEQILEREVARPLASEVFARVAARSPVDLGRPAAELLTADGGLARAARSSLPESPSGPPS
jgi:hypothetical protein